MQMKFKAEYFWLAVFAVCFLAFSVIQDSIRPNYSGTSHWVHYILGVAPNFFPGIGIPAFFVLVIPVFDKRNSTKKWLNVNRYITANVISLIGLVTWEFLQLLTSNGSFDWNDILWTIIGAMIFHLLWIITPAYLKMIDGEDPNR
jgi:hypothetical protein